MGKFYKIEKQALTTGPEGETVVKVSTLMMPGRKK